MHFRDRTEAGRLLAEALAKKYSQVDAVVYPLPRGGLPLGIEVARALHVPLDLIIPRKIGHPYSPEYAICAVSEHGDTVCNEREVASVDSHWLEHRVTEERAESRRRREVYSVGRTAPELEGRMAILVDDGIATGLTMRAAILDAWARKAEKVVVAVPVVPADTEALLRQEVDDVVALSVDKFYLGAVGAYYDEFDQLSDEEVVAILRRFDLERA
ncbi:MAG: phosphoribosyltransferase family protein [Gammaproteobacteria bacterium]|nr:phosphoribosyltransferase family protein [Gammaproteobacteria bacterium]